MSIRNFAFWTLILLLPSTLIFILHINDNIVIIVDIILIWLGALVSSRRQRFQIATLKVDGHEVEYTYSKEALKSIFVLEGYAQKRARGHFVVAQTPHGVDIPLPDSNTMALNIPATLVLRGKLLSFSMSKQKFILDSGKHVICYTGLGLFGSDDEWYWSGVVSLDIINSGKRRKRRKKRSMKLDEKIRALLPQPQPAS